MFISNARVICNLILTGLLERYPKLKFVSVESGIGWIPFILEALDYETLARATVVGEPDAMMAAARIILLLTVSGAFVLACMAISNPTIPALVTAASFDVLIVIPVVLLYYWRG